jgi:hypothetical protein
MSEDENSLDPFKLVTVERFRDLPEALLAKGSLESAGIRCILADDNMVRMDWFISNLIGGVKLLVEPQDAAEAKEILQQATPEAFDVEGVGEYQQPRCPKCGSLDIEFEPINRKIAYPTAWLGVPLPVHHKAWRCRACTAEWDDADAPANEDAS